MKGNVKMDENDLREWYDKECTAELVRYRTAGGADGIEDAESLLKHVRHGVHHRLTESVKAMLDPNTHPASDLTRLLAEGVIASQKGV